MKTDEFLGLNSIFFTSAIHIDDKLEKLETFSINMDHRNYILGIPFGAFRRAKNPTVG